MRRTIVQVSQHQSADFNIHSSDVLIGDNVGTHASARAGRVWAKSRLLRVPGVHREYPTATGVEIAPERAVADPYGNEKLRQALRIQLGGHYDGIAVWCRLGEDLWTLYGVTAYAVARRRIEIGIRMAIGAAPADVVRMVLSRVSLLVGVGALAGAGISVWASTFLPSLLYGLEPRDPATLMGSAVVLVAVAALAGWLPARRASRMGPTDVRRQS